VRVTCGTLHGLRPPEYGQGCLTLFYTTKRDGNGHRPLRQPLHRERHHGRLWAERTMDQVPRSRFPFPGARQRHAAPVVSIHDGQGLTGCARQYQSLIDGCRLSVASFNDARSTRNEALSDGQAFTGVGRSMTTSLSASRCRTCCGSSALPPRRSRRPKRSSRPMSSARRAVCSSTSRCPHCRARELQQELIRRRRDIPIVFITRA